MRAQIRPGPDSAKRIPHMRVQAQCRFYLLWRGIGAARAEFPAADEYLLTICE